APELAWVTVDGGENWSPLSPPSAPSTAPVADGPLFISDLQFLNDTDGWAIATSCPGCPIVLEATQDGGTTWARIPPPDGTGSASSRFALRVGRGGDLWLYVAPIRHELRGPALHRTDCAPP